jgi:HKD family nuclease
MAKVEFILQPYDSALSRSAVDVLIAELDSKNWSEAWFTVAFGLKTGNYPDLLAAITNFCNKGGKLHLTFGADTFAAGGGTEFEAVEELTNLFAKIPNAQLYLFHENGNVFHPKVYLFFNAGHAVVLIGSSNWSHKGLEANQEANALIKLDLADPADKAAFDHLTTTMTQYWKEP